jgi:hypothetical protein
MDLGRARLYGVFDFEADRSGTVAIIFALCLFSLGLTAGLAIDYERGVNLHVSMRLTSTPPFSALRAAAPRPERSRQWRRTSSTRTGGKSTASKMT